MGPSRATRQALWRRRRLTRATPERIRARPTKAAAESRSDSTAQPHNTPNSGIRKLISEVKVAPALIGESFRVQ